MNSFFEFAYTYNSYETGGPHEVDPFNYPLASESFRSRSV